MPQSLEESVRRLKCLAKFYRSIGLDETADACDAGARAISTKNTAS